MFNRKLHSAARIYVNLRQGKEYRRVEDISAELGTSSSYIGLVITGMRRKGLVDTRRGHGVRLAKGNARLTMGELAGIVDLSTTGLTESFLNTQVCKVYEDG